MQFEIQQKGSWSSRVLLQLRAQRTVILRLRFSRPRGEISRAPSAMNECPKFFTVFFLRVLSEDQEYGCSQERISALG
jgi:hypothetical protein